MDKKLKYIFHASKVDRIAIVDRPAVPDAELLIYKSEKPVEGNESIEKQSMFEKEFLGAQASSAVQVLESLFWRSLYDTEVKDKLGEFQKNLKSFKSVLVSIIEQIPNIDSEKAEGPTTEDILLNFKRGLEVSAMSEAFTYFKQTVWSLVASAEVMKNASPVAKAICDAFSEFVNAHTESIVSKAMDSVVLDKEGRIISTARLKKLAEAMEVLRNIIDEATPKSKDNLTKSIQEVNKMDEKAIQEMFTKALAPLHEELAKIQSILKEKGIITPELTAEEKTAKEEAEKLEAEKKAKEEADAKVEAEKLEATVKAEAEKQAKEATEIKGQVDALGKELTEVKAKLEVYQKAFSAFEKRTGVKVSLDVDEKKSHTSGDPFGEAVRGDSKKK